MGSKSRHASPSSKRPQPSPEEQTVSFTIPDVSLVYVSDWASVIRREGSIYFGFGQTTLTGQLLSAVVVRMNRDTAFEIVRTTASILDGLNKQLEHGAVPAHLGDPEQLDQVHLMSRIAHDRASLMTVTYVGPEAEFCIHRLAVGPLQQVTQVQDVAKRSALARQVAVPVMRVELPTALAHAVIQRLAQEVSTWQ